MAAQITSTQKDILWLRVRAARLRGHTHNWTNELAPVRSRGTVRAQWVLGCATGVRSHGECATGLRSHGCRHEESRAKRSKKSRNAGFFGGLRARRGRQPCERSPDTHSPSHIACRTVPRPRKRTITTSYNDPRAQSMYTALEVHSHWFNAH